MNWKEVIGFHSFLLSTTAWPTVGTSEYLLKLKLGFDLLNAEKMKTSY